MSKDISELLAETTQSASDIDEIGKVSEKQIENLLQKTQSRASHIEDKIENAYDPQQSKDRGRNFLTYAFIVGYFLIFFICFIYAWKYNTFLIKNGCEEHLIDLTDMVLKIGGVLGSSLGFVLGYYFKTSETNAKQKNS